MQCEFSRAGPYPWVPSQPVLPQFRSKWFGLNLMSMRRASWTFLIASLSCSICFSQTAPSQGTAATTAPPPAAATQSPEQPQKQMPPDTKAPLPLPSAKPQSDSIPSAPESSQPQLLKSGTEIRATLDTPLSTKTSKVGDRFTATVNAPVRGVIGNIIIPAGSKLNGQISDSNNEKLADAI